MVAPTTLLYTIPFSKKNFARVRELSMAYMRSWLELIDETDGVLVDGIASRDVQKELLQIDVRTRHWSQVPLHTSSPRGGPPPLRTGHRTTVHAGRLLLFGGLREDGQFLDDITTVELIS